MRSQLKESFNLELFSLLLRKEQTLCEAILDWYSDEICFDCLVNTFSLQEVESNERNERDKFDSVNLFIVTDDALHPYINQMINSFVQSIQARQERKRKCKCCDKDDEISEAIIQCFISFDNVSIVPARSLFNEVIDSLNYSPTDSEMISLLLTR